MTAPLTLPPLAAFLRPLALAAALTAPVAAQAAIEIQEVTSPGGITAWLVEEHSIPFVALDIRVKGGANLDRPGKRGAVNLMMATLEEGAGDRDAQAFAEAAETLGAGFGFEAYNDSVSITASMLTETRDESVALLRDAIMAPRFEDDAVARVRDQVLAVIQQDANDPEEIASATFSALAFPDHPYGSPLEGTPETVAALTPEDLRQAHGDVLSLDRIRVGVTGDITPEELGALLDDLLGDLPAEGPPLPEMADYALGGGVTVTDYPSPQSVVLFGHESIARDDPDFFPAFVLNHVLGGGGFGSILMEEVRERRGLTYGIGTYLVPRDFAAQHLGQFSSSNDKTAEAVAIVRDEWATLAAEGFDPEAIEKAKTFLTGAYPLRFDGNANIAGILAGMQVQGLPIDYVTERNAYVEAVTPEEVNRVAARILAPEALHFVVVGQPEGLATGALPEG